jgi:glucose/arabinose dehydrogenase
LADGRIVFGGVAIDASGAIFVTGDMGNVLYRITKR